MRVVKHMTGRSEMLVTRSAWVGMSHLGEGRVTSAHRLFSDLLIIIHKPCPRHYRASGYGLSYGHRLSSAPPRDPSPPGESEHSLHRRHLPPALSISATASLGVPTPATAPPSPQRPPSSITFSPSSCRLDHSTRHHGGKMYSSLRCPLSRAHSSTSRGYHSSSSLSSSGTSESPESHTVTPILADSRLWKKYRRTSLFLIQIPVS